MQIIDGWRDVGDDVRRGVVAIGNFDGVHCGHQALIGRTIEIARKIGAPAGVMVFEPQPREFFHPDEPHFRLTPLDMKLEILATLGLDFVVVVPFDKDFAALESWQFSEDVLVGRLGVLHVVIGYDFFYGKARRGSPETMLLAGIENDFEVTIVEPVAEGGEAFSSTGIRLKLAEGNVKGAARDMGRLWRVRGQVVGGAKRGTGLGYPTANVPMPKGTTLGHGIYAVRVHLDGQKRNDQPLDGAAYLGTRPTFDDGKPVLEVFLLDFEGDLYGRVIDVEFVAFIRPDRKFDTSEALVSQMDEDILAVKQALAAA